MEFGHIRRMRDRRFPHEIAVIMPGEYFVSATPMIVSTVLGSCVSVCLRDPLVGVGGMNHFILTEPSSHSSADAWIESGRYGSYAMELLINEILKRGGRKPRLEAKVFGGGRIYQGATDIGARNAAWAITYLEQEGLSIVKADVGDVYPRKVYFFTDTGRVLLKKLDSLHSRTLQREEERYRSSLMQATVAGEVTLF
ncbi:MAG: chemoreceptor glutamine deamidase CheD [Nitrospirae bacterium]|nr:MAG: chemoreceptor glutamine deamidase CheD [Nitrospirota bacterium]